MRVNDRPQCPRELLHQVRRVRSVVSGISLVVTTEQMLQSLRDCVECDSVAVRRMMVTIPMNTMVGDIRIQVGPACRQNGVRHPFFMVVN